jgi:hypothetical protein
VREPDFENSADMRLLELQRSALGLAPRDRTAWETRYAEGTLPGEEASQAVDVRTPVLAVELSGTPSSGVIPGAVVTLSLSVVNEGAAPAGRVTASVPLPGGASYRAGSFMQNGRVLPDELAQGFFGAGLTVESLAPGERTGFVWKIGVRIGTRPLVAAPQVRAQGAAIIGARPLTIARKERSAGAFAAELVQRDAAHYQPRPLIAVDIPVDALPIYELDEEEQLVYEAADAALSSAAKPNAEPAFDKLGAAPEQTLAPIGPSTNDAPPEIAAQAPPAREGAVRYGRFDRATLAFFERTFSGSRPPAILQHCIFAGALACAADSRGTDEAQLRRHLDAQSQVLHRIALHEKLGKKEPIAEYAGELLADLEALRPERIEPMPPAPHGLTLVAELEQPTLAVIAKIAQERDRWDFVKARQLTLALQAQRALVADAAHDAAIANALRKYAQISMTTLQKLFVRIRLDRTTGILFAQEPALDAAARSVLAALAAAF